MYRVVDVCTYLHAYIHDCMHNAHICLYMNVFTHTCMVVCVCILGRLITPGDLHVVSLLK